MENRTYQVNKPYPQMVALAQNKAVAKMLLKSYCGAVSELTSVNQYLYHLIKAQGQYVSVSDALRGIALVEQNHLYLLGSCINQLGISPKYRVASEKGPLYWDAQTVFYGSDTKDMLLANIALEEKSIRQYTHTAGRIANTQVQALLARIVEDEQLHVRILRDLYNQYF